MILKSNCMLCTNGATCTLHGIPVWIIIQQNEIQLLQWGGSRGWSPPLLQKAMFSLNCWASLATACWLQILRDYFNDGLSFKMCMCKVIRVDLYHRDNDCSIYESSLEFQPLSVFARIRSWGGRGQTTMSPPLQKTFACHCIVYYSTYGKTQFLSYRRSLHNDASLPSVKLYLHAV